MPSGPDVVVIINSNPDLVRLMRFAFESAGFVVFEYLIDGIRNGTEDLETLVEEHDPKVVIYDVAPPYDHNWNFLEHLRRGTHLKSRRFVLTSMNARRLREIVDVRDEMIYEIVGRQEDIGEVVRAVKEASRARPTR